MKSLILFFILLISTVIRAQDIIEGHVVDSEKNDMIKATVKCLINDSIYLCGTTTNSKGMFKLEVPKNESIKKMIFNYVGYKECVLTINKTKEKIVRLGDIIMDKNTRQLHEVTVQGCNMIKTEEKTMIYPTKDEIRHAYDGYSALDVVRVPGLNVNAINSTVSYHNQGVQLCIDGRKVTKEEVQDLNPKDIKRIDLYTQGMPEYPDSYAVIDYILKERDYAGSISFNALHNNTPKGNMKATAQYFEDKSEFTVSASGSYNHLNRHDKGESTTIYHFPDETIMRTNYSLPSLSDGNNIGTYANYLYKDKKQSLHTSLRFNRKENLTDIRNCMAYSTEPTIYTKHEHSNLQTINPSLRLQYKVSLPHKQRLLIEAYGSYGNNHYDRWYENRNDESVASSYSNGTHEDSYYMNSTINYTKTFKNNSSVNLTLNHNRTHTDDDNMRDGILSNLSLDKKNTKLNITYKYSIKKKLSIQANLAGHIANTETNGKEYTDFFFIPYLRIRWMLKNHTLNLSATARSYEASNANRTGDEYRINEYEMFVGNPELKDYVNYNTTLTHNWDISKRISWVNYVEFIASPNSNYKLINYDAGYDAFVNKNINIKRNWSLHYETGLDYEVVPGMVYMQALLLGYYSGFKDQTLSNVYFAGSLRFQHKGWRVRVGYMSPTNGWDYSSGLRIKESSDLSMSMSYSINNWNIGIGYTNPFKATTRTSFNNGEYEQYTSSRTPHISDNYGYIMVSHRFTFGKKKHKFDNSEIQNVNQTTISQLDE